MQKQTQLKFWKSSEKCHGGSFAKGKRKGARAIVTKNPMHLTLKSSRAKGKWSFFRQEKALKAKVYAIAKKFRVRIYGYQNVGNHLHLAVQAASRREFQNFLRVVTQAIAYLVTGTRKGSPVGKFFDALAFTRVVQWGKDWRNLKRYLSKNALEAAGVPRNLVDRWFREANSYG